MRILCCLCSAGALPEQRSGCNGPTDGAVATEAAAAPQQGCCDTHDAALRGSTECEHHAISFQVAATSMTSVVQSFALHAHCPSKTINCRLALQVDWRCLRFCAAA